MVSKLCLRNLIVFTMFPWALILTAMAEAQDVFILENASGGIIYKSSFSTPHVKTQLIGSLGVVGGMASDYTSGDLYFSTGSNTQVDGKIVRVNKDGSNMTEVSLGRAFPGAVAVSPATDSVYFVENDTPSNIYRVGMSGSPAAALIVAGDAGIGGPVDVAVDDINAKLYWVDTRSKVFRSNLDGSSKESVTNTIGGELTGIGIDNSSGKVFWQNNETKDVQFVNLTGPFPATPSISVDSSLIGGGGLALDTNISPVRIFWTNFTSIVGTALDGGTASALIDANDGLQAAIDVAVYTEPTPTPTATVTATATPLSQILVPGTTIENEPEVTVNNRSVTVELRPFSGVSNSAQASTGLLAAAAAQDLVFRYDVKLKAPRRSDSQELLSKRNTVTFRGLKPGSYSVNYSAVAYAKRSKSQIQKQKQQGKEGFAAQFKKIFTTNRSPAAAFTISKP